MNLYQIAGWDRRYENNRTRELKKLDWVPIPNKQDGEGYTLIMAQGDGPSLLGAWMAIIQLASKCDVRGTLMRDTGVPHDSASIARQSRFPHEVIDRALIFFSSRDVGWLKLSEIEVLTEAPQDGAGFPQESALKGREGNRRELPPQVPVKLPRFIEEAIDWMAVSGVPELFTREVFLEHEGTTWTYAGKPITNWKSYLSSRWLKIKSIQAERQRYMTAPKRPIYKSPSISRPQVVPDWMKIVEEIKRLLPNPETNIVRLQQLGNVLPQEGWLLLDKLTEWNQLNKILKEKP